MKRQTQSAHLNAAVQTQCVEVSSVRLFQHLHLNLGLSYTHVQKGGSNFFMYLLVILTVFSFIENSELHQDHGLMYY